MINQKENKPNISIIVPAYKNASLLRACVTSLLENIGELDNYNTSLLIINDSPDDTDVSSYLGDLEREGIDIIVNSKNQGFIISVNKALKFVSKKKGSVILVNSDTLTFPGTLKNLVTAAFSDPQIGFACPRSNNAALSTFPHFPHRRSGLSISPHECYDVWASLADKLPLTTPSPTAVGFYLFIKDRVLYELDNLDEDFELGYEEENDLIMRANKLGFISVLSNKSFAYHAGSASFNLVYKDLDEHKSKNLEKQVLKNPEFIPLVREYESSAYFYADKMMRNFIPFADGRYPVVFDLRRIWKSFNGTSKITRLILENLCQNLTDRYVFYALCDEEIFHFHKFSDIKNLKIASTVQDDYTVSINLGQPFDLDQINTLEKLAPINIYGMMDIIAHDCGYLRVENKFNLDRYWGHVASHADGLYFISEFSRDTFTNRFAFDLKNNLRRREFTQLHPTTTDSYVSFKTVGRTNRSGRHILVLGNHFKHKHSYETAKTIADYYQSASIVCFGNSNSVHGNLRTIKSGDVEENSMIEIFSSASLVVLPSFYEGFGIGIVEALGYGLPIVARNIPPTLEILASYDEYKGVYLFNTTEEMLEAIPIAAGGESYAIGGINWDQWVSNFSKFLSDIINSEDIYEKLYNKFISSRSLNEHNMLREKLNNSEKNISINEVKPNSAEFQQSIISVFMEKDDADFIRGIYRVALGREADVAGLKNYGLLLNKGGDRLQVFRDILFSSEAREKLPEIDSYKFNKKFFRI